jgi:alginate O-acetyltransferase complex protein AlgI
MLLMTKISNPAATAYLGVVAFFVTFLVMGIWHGTTAVFVIYGLLMGAGASVNKLWQLACTRRLGKKPYRALTQTMAYSYLARGLTFAYFTLALTCLWMPELPQFLALTGRLGTPGLAGALIMLTVAFAGVTLVADAISTGLSTRSTALHTLSGGFVLRNLSLAGKVLAILAIASLFNKSPDFVYKAF